MAKRKAKKKTLSQYERRLLQRINKEHIPGDQLRRFADEVHQLNQGEGTFEAMSFVALRLFDANPDRMISAHFRVVALAKIVSGGSLPGWTRTPQPDGSIMTHSTLFDAAGQVPLRLKGDVFFFSRAILLKKSFQLAKPIKG